MPIVRGFDSEGCFYRYGETGKAYHYKCGDEQARQIAYDKAREQEIAIGEFSVIKFKSYTDYLQGDAGIEWAQRKLKSLE